MICIYIYIYNIYIYIYTIYIYIYTIYIYIYIYIYRYNERRERYGDYIIVIIVRRSNYILDICNKDDR